SCSLFVVALALAVSPRAARAGDVGAKVPGPRPSVTPADAEAAPTGGPARPLLGLAPRPSSTPDVPKAPEDPALRRAWLKAQLDEALAAPALAKAKVGVYAIESDTGKPVYARNETTPLNAASNVKLVTSAAALSLLGPEYRWRTTLATTAAATGGGGELAGDLVLRGGGDPTLGVEDLAAMVADLVALGVHKVHGGLVVDDRFFDMATVAPAFDQKNESTASRAPSSAASLNYNVVAVTVIPGATAGALARVTLEPASPYFVLSGTVTTATDGPAAPAVETKDEGGTRTRITVAGRVRLGSEPRTFYRRVVHPALFAGASLRQQLERRGIIVDKPTRVAAAPPQGQRVLSTHESPPLAVVVQDLNKRSNNFMAEQVVRTLGAEIVGRPGTWDKGLEAVGRFLASAGLPRGSYQMTNGSGLYDSNRFTPAQITTVLRATARDFRLSAEFLSSLAVAGTDGTIAHRMGGTLAERYVRAKTGTLAGVSCLSGFAGSPGHVPLIFSVLINDVPNAAEARRAQDRVAELLVAYLETTSSPQP
ncbi:MAG: D-alanyl-D-alanine carboxypeptidase/D-alanyl-D-alanine-endopeptidase, partial [Myxococcales bacterium]|nr:D-alanyl-D-alanine carboxypeptidase/D-alanyl-D-alanine-endopeptidase [Myxococcales bacterium]